MTKADWLRSEIEKLEQKRKSTLEYTKTDRITLYEDGYRSALTSIITRYKEELKVLENK